MLALWKNLKQILHIRERIKFADQRAKDEIISDVLRWGLKHEDKCWQTIKHIEVNCTQTALKEALPHVMTD